MSLAIKSNENWNVGVAFLEDGKLNFAANRLYYAMFQAVYEFAKVHDKYKGSGGSVHGDMQRIVGREGKSSRKMKNEFSRLRSYRETADYEQDSPNETKINKVLASANKIRLHYLKRAGH